MYDYRDWSPEKQKKAVRNRLQRGFPMHSPPHLIDATGFRIITAACYEHTPILDTPQRLAWFENELLTHIKDERLPCAAWVVLPNHYHLLVKIDDIKKFATALGQLHGRTSFEMNKADGLPGRKVWYRSEDRMMRSERHYYTSINYIHNNPVKHSYVDKWGDWPYSSYHWYLEHKGKKWLVELWREYPVLNYGLKWDTF